MKRLAGFLAVAFALTAALAAAGYCLLPRFYGLAGAQAAIWASAVALFGSLAGVVPLLSGSSSGSLSGSAPETQAGSRQSAGASSGAVGTVPGSPLAGASRFLLSMLLRLGAVGIGALGVGLFGVVSLEPFLLWLAVSYLALLVVDTVLTLKVFRSL